MIKVYLKNGETLTFYEAGNVLIETATIHGEGKGVLTFNFIERDINGAIKDRRASFFVDEIFGFSESVN